MGLQKIELENFKCFKSKIEIDLGKLTLLTGANSSGKSSILYSILGTIQSGEFPYRFSPNGKYVNMGDFNEIVFNHEKKQNIKINFNFENKDIERVETIWMEDSKNKLPKLFQLKVVSPYFKLLVKHHKRTKYLINFEYNAQDDPRHKYLIGDSYKKFVSTVSDFLGEDDEITDSKKTEKVKDKELSKRISDRYNALINSQKLDNIEIDEKDLGTLDKQDIRLLKLQQIFDILLEVFNSYDNNISFISSFRLHPDRDYLETSKSNLKVGIDGKGYLDQIMAWETNKSKKFNKLIEVLRQLNLLVNIKSKRISSGKYDILVKIRNNGVFTSLYDVGFGISQFLPIVVADLQLGKASTLYVAQPEIHLHPSIQSTFGDYLIEQIKSNSKRYVIETHSEYLLNKVRLGIVKNEIGASDVEVYYIDNQQEEPSIHKITFNKQGQILDAPDNFFKTYMIDVMEIAINASN